MILRGCIIRMQDLTRYIVRQALSSKFLKSGCIHLAGLYLGDNCSDFSKAPIHYMLCKTCQLRHMNLHVTRQLDGISLEQDFLQCEERQPHVVGRAYNSLFYIRLLSCFHIKSAIR